MTEKRTSADFGLSGMTTLDLPEPMRSKALAILGRTAAEFAAHLLGWEENEAWLDAEARAGRYPLVEEMHYTDAPLAVVAKKSR